MTATTLSRAAQVAAVHLRPINESRRRAGLAPLTAAELTREFADLDCSPPRAKVGTAADEHGCGRFNVDRHRRPAQCVFAQPSADRGGAHFAGGQRR